jgi:hypothetical protein
VDHVLALTRQLGFWAIVLPTWGSGVVGNYDGKDPKDALFTPENARAYAAWLAQRYGKEPHVWWMMGGDRAAVNGPNDSRPTIRAMAEPFAELQPAPLMSYHSRKGAPQSAEWFHGDTWLSFNSIQEWPDRQLAHVANDWTRSPPKPTWLFEGRYEGYFRGNYQAAQWGEWQCRIQAYQTVFAGAFGHTYGHERVFGFGLDGVDWKEHLDSPGARSMTHLAALMAHFGSDRTNPRQPDQELLDATPRLPERLRSEHIAATRDSSRTRAMVYSASGRPIRIRLDRLAKQPFAAFWFNPRRGTWHVGERESTVPAAFASNFSGGAGAAPREFVPPTSGDGHDWVLVVRASNSR